MKRMFTRLGLMALVSSALFGCGGGGSDGVSSPGATVTVPVNVSNKQTIALNSTAATTASTLAWRALTPQVTVTGVTIASPPVVKFAVTDASGNAVVGLGNTATNPTTGIKALTNLSFSLAKLVPATATEPSKWVSYLVLNPATTAQKAGTIAANESCTVDRQWCGTLPTTDNEGTLVDNGDGTYQYTFARDVALTAGLVANLVDSTDGSKKKADLGDVSYDRTLTHRVGIQISGSAPGTGTNVPNATQTVAGVNMAVPTNIVFDFRPDGAAVTTTRSVVAQASCNSCHNGKGLAHDGGRKDPNLCVTCHTDQIKYGMSTEATRTTLALSGTTAVVDGRAVGNFTNFAHKIHMGSKLRLTGYNYSPATNVPAMKFNDVAWIQDPRNCTKCHSGTTPTDPNQAVQTKDGNNWQAKPSRLACGSCHDNVNFATGVITPTATNARVAHSAGAAADDSSCATCHTSAAVAESHRTEAPTANNATPVTGISTISYEIKSVALNATRQPEITFRIMKDGAAVTTFATPTPTQNATTGVYSVPTTFEAIPGFRGGPTFYVAYAVPQDGITAPADFNTYQSASLLNMLVASGHPKAGSIAPAANAADAAMGYLTATLTGSAGQAATVAGTPPIACPKTATTITGYCANPTAIIIPTTAKMVTGAMIGNFTQVSFTGVNAATLTTKYNPTTGTITKGLVIKTPLKQMLATGIVGNTARRVVVDTNKCEACHEQLGTAVDFHGGARNDATSCAICHNPNRTSGGWAANASTFVHGIHAGTSPASVVGASAALGTGVNSPGSGAGGAGTGFSSGKRTIPFSWHRDSSGFNAASVVYPGVLKNCDGCHVPNAVNFGADGATLLPNLLWSTSGTGKYNSATDTTYKVLPRDPVTGLITYLTADNIYSYGNIFSFTPEGSVVASYTPAAIVAPATTPTAAAAVPMAAAPAPVGGTTIAADKETFVESPITSACFACHDASVAKLHMAQYGGVIYGPRKNSDSTFPTTGVFTGTLINKETCLTCHGMGKVADAAAVHAK